MIRGFRSHSVLRLLVFMAVFFAPLYAIKPGTNAGKILENPNNSYKKGFATLRKASVHDFADVGTVVQKGKLKLGAKKVSSLVESFDKKIPSKGLKLQHIKTQLDKKGNQHIRFMQFYKKIPVLGSDIIVHVNANGEVFAVSGNIAPALDVSTSAKVSMQAAITNARKKLQLSTHSQAEGTPRLVIFDGKLAYEFLVVETNQGIPAKWRTIVDAESGEVLFTENKIRHAAPGINGAHVAIQGVMLAGEGGSTVSFDSWQDAGANYFLYHKTQNWGVYNEDKYDWEQQSTADWATNDPAAISLGYNLFKTQEYVSNVLGWQSFNDDGILAVGNVHVGSSYVNAYWDGSQFYFGDGDGITANALTTLDIVAHEYAHALTDYSSDLIYSYESGALNESFSDIFGALVEFSAQPDGRAMYPTSAEGQSDWLIGEDAWLEADALRDMRDPQRYGQPSYYKGTYWYSGAGDNGGVHYNNGVQNFAFYLLAEGGTGTNDGVPYSITGLGIEVAGEIAMYANMYLLTSSAQFQDAREAWLLAASTLGYDTQNVAAVWTAVGVLEQTSLLSVSPTELDFGNVATGASKSLTVSLVNNGSLATTVSGYSLNATFFTVNDSAPLVVGPGSSVNVTISFLPVDQAQVEGTLSIESNASDNPLLQVHLQGAGAAPAQIVVAPESIHHTLLSGESYQTQLQISNPGDADLAWSMEGIRQSTFDFSWVNTQIDRTFRQKIVPSEAKSNQASAFSPVVSLERLADAPQEGESVLIFRDVLPWGLNVNEPLLESLGATVSIASSASMATIDLSQYDMILIASVQPNSFYQAFVNSLGRFESYVANGGKMQIHACIFSSDRIASMPLPGGLTLAAAANSQTTNYIVNMDHPIASGALDSVVTGSYANHESFENLPANGIVITQTAGGEPTTVEYSLGAGMIVATGMTWEYGWSLGWDSADPLLPNALGYVLAEGTGASWLHASKTSGIIPGGSTEIIPLTLTADGLQGGLYEQNIEITHNIVGLNTIVVPVSLVVDGVKSLVASHAQLDFGSVIVGATDTLILTVTNGGDEVTTISEIASDHGDFVVQGAFPMAVQGFSDAQVAILFAPKQFESYAASLTIQSDAEDNSTIVVGLAGIGMEGPKASLVPTTLTFDLNPGDAPADQTSVLSSIGAIALNYQVTGVLETSQPFSMQLTGNAKIQPEYSKIYSTPNYSYDHVPGELIVAVQEGASSLANNHSIHSLGIANMQELAIAKKPGTTINAVRGRRYYLVSLEDESHTMLRTAIDAIRHQSGVLYVEPNYIRTLNAIPDDASFGSLYGLHNTGQTGGTPGADIDAVKAWETHKGSGSTVIGVIDTGIDYLHPDLADNIWVNPGEIPGNGIDDDGNGYVDDVHGYDFINNDSDPMDGHSHGTHVAGTIAARGNNGMGVVGVNWQASLMAIKIFSDGGSTNDATILNAVAYANAMGVKVTNNSWGGGPFSQSLKDIINDGAVNGYLFIAAAGNNYGNNNDTSPQYPASYDCENIISVASTDHNDLMSSFSNYGATSVDLAAPGSNVYSTTPSGNYGSKSGTSMATPHVAGAAGLLMSYNPSLSGAEIKQILLEAVDIIPSVSGKVLSNGRLNVANAIENAGAAWLQAAPAEAGILAPGTTQNITVTVDPKGLLAGQYTGQVAIATNDIDNPALFIDVIANISGCKSLTVTANHLEFDEIWTSQTDSTQLVLSNPCNEATLVSLLSVDQNSFSVSEEENLLIAPFDSQTVTVYFHPEAEGLVNGVLTIESNADANPIQTIHLSGSAKVAPGIAVTPNSFAFSMLPEESQNEVLLVQNTGGSILQYTIASSGGTGVVINEFCSNPDFIELQNYGGNQDISGWKLEWTDNAGSDVYEYTFPLGSVIAAGKRVVLRENSGTNNDSTFYLRANIGWVTGSVVSIALLDNEGKGIDFVRTTGSIEAPPEGVNWSGNVGFSSISAFRSSDQDTDKDSDWSNASSHTEFSINPGQSQQGAPATWLQIGDFVGELAPSEIETIPLTINTAGLVPDIYTASLIIEHNVPGEPKVEVPIALTVVACDGNANIAFSPDSYEEFLISGATVTKSLTITNSGNCPATVALDVVDNSTLMNGESSLASILSTKKQGGNYFVSTVGNNSQSQDVSSTPALLSVEEFTGVNSGSVGILLWSKYSDNSAGGELNNTLNAISQHFTDFTSDTTSTTDPAVLASMLANKQVFIIPEQERLTPDLTTLGVAWQAVLQSFLDNGGKIIYCGTSQTGAEGILEGAGLLSFDYQATYSGTINLKNPSHELAQGISAAFPYSNATFGYNVHSTDIDTILAQSTNGRVISAIRYVSNGAVILIGFDYYAYDINASRILANAVQLETTPAWLQLSQQNLEIPAGESRTMDVTFNATDLAVGVYEKSIVVQHNATNVISPYSIPAILHIHNNTTYSIVSSAGVGGSISPEGTTVVDSGASVTYSIVPEAGYEILDVLVDGVSVGAVGSYTFSNVLSDHSIEAQFVEIPVPTYSLVSSALVGGSISPAGITVVDSGSSITYTIAPEAGYEILDVLVDGVSVGAVSSYTFSSVLSDHSIEAQFTALLVPTYSLVSSALVGGSISPAGITVVDSGSSITYTIAPEAGYEILDVLVDGVSVGAVASYTFSSVLSDHSIEARFTVASIQVCIEDPIPAASEWIFRNIWADQNGGATIQNAESALFLSQRAWGYANGWIINSGNRYSLQAGEEYTIKMSVKEDPKYGIDAMNIGFATGYQWNEPHLMQAKVAMPTDFNSSSYSTREVTFVAEHSGDFMLSIQLYWSGTGAERISNYIKDIAVCQGNGDSLPVPTYSLVSSAGLGGSISPAGITVVDSGSSITYTIAPEAGYEILDVLVDGVSVGAVGSYTFSSVLSDHSIEAQFVELPVPTYSLVSSAGLGGSISPAGITVVDSGSSITYTIAPEAGYEILDVLVDGVSVGAVGSYTFSSVLSDHSIEAQFVELPVPTYSLVSSAGLGGSISPAGITVVDSGSSITYTIAPEAGYEILDVLVDGVSVGAVGSYTFSSVLSDHSIEAQFVELPVPTYSLVSSAGLGGSISPAGITVVDSGSSITYTIAPEAGYEILDVLVDGVSVGAVGSYTFSSVLSDHSIEAQFAELPVPTYSLVSSAGLGGSISPAGITVVDSGSSITYTIAPEAGYEILDVLVDGVSVGAVGSYTFSSVLSDHSIEAQFAELPVPTYSLVSSAGLGGSISPAGITVVDSGSSITYTIAPEAGYEILDVLVDGVSVGAVSSYTFSSVLSDHSIEAQFTALLVPTYSLVSSAGLGGSISPAGITVVDSGSSITYTIAPEAGYEILDVLVDGVSVGAVSSYTFSSVLSDHSIEAQFVELPVPTYSLVSSAGLGGSISPAGITVVDSGSSITYTIAPEAGYEILDVLVDGVSVGAVGSYTFSSVLSDHSIEAQFAELPVPTYSLVSSAGLGGSISPAGITVVDSGSSITYTIAPEAGYEILDVLVDGVSVGAVGSYTFSSVLSDHSIEAQFVLMSTQVCFEDVLPHASEWIFRNNWTDQNVGTTIQNAEDALLLSQRAWGYANGWLINSGKRYTLEAGKEYTIRFSVKEDPTVGINAMNIGFATGYQWNEPHLIQAKVAVETGFNSTNYSTREVSFIAEQSGDFMLSIQFYWPGAGSQSILNFVKDIEVCSSASTVNPFYFAKDSKYYIPRTKPVTDEKSYEFVPNELDATLFASKQNGYLGVQVSNSGNNEGKFSLISVEGSVIYQSQLYSLQQGEQVFMMDIGNPAPGRYYLMLTTENAYWSIPVLW
jgi:Zn-dependent metalloprotease/subtilisin family serine protease